MIFARLLIRTFTQSESVHFGDGKVFGLVAPGYQMAKVAQTHLIEGDCQRI